MSERLLALFFIFVSVLRADDNGSWSQSVLGLRGRLIIPAHQDLSIDPFLKVYLELQNVVNALGDQSVPYSNQALTMQVVDEAGTELAPAGGAYDGVSAMPDTIILPYDSTLRFLINGHGLGVPPGTRQIIDFDSRSWIIPPLGGHTYFLLGTFTTKQPSGGHSLLDWHGTLELPKVRIPAP